MPPPMPLNASASDRIEAGRRPWATFSWVLVTPPAPVSLPRVTMVWLSLNAYPDVVPA